MALRSHWQNLNGGIEMNMWMMASACRHGKVYGQD